MNIKVDEIIDEIIKIQSDDDLKEVLKNLKDNPAFQMSLSGKELFHSNMIAMFLTQQEDIEKVKTKNGKPVKVPTPLAKQMISFFPPIIDKEGKKDYVVFDVLREYKNLDLVICYCTQDDKNILSNNNIHCVSDLTELDTDNDENMQDDSEKTLPDEVCTVLKEMHYVIVENKFKSFPYKEQLDKYSNKEFSVFPKCNIKKRTYYLLAPENSLCAFYNTDKKERKFTRKFGSKIIKSKKTIDKTADWTGKSYEDYWKQLVNYYINQAIEEKNSRQKFLLDFIKEYCNFLNIMIAIYDYCVEKRIKDGKWFLRNNHNTLLVQTRIQDFYEKIICNRNLCKIRDEASKNEAVFPKDSETRIFDKETNDKDWPFFFSDSSYTRQTGIVDFRYIWKKSYVNAGIGIQGSSFRIIYCWERDKFKKVFGIDRADTNFNNFMKDNFKEDQNNKKWQKNYQEFYENKNSDITKKIITSIYEKILIKLKNELKDYVFPDHIGFKKNGDIPSFVVKDKYVFIYGNIDLNTIYKKNENSTINNKEAYRDLSYELIKQITKISLDVIKEKCFEDLKTEIEKKIKLQQKK